MILNTLTMNDNQASETFSSSKFDTNFQQVLGMSIEEYIRFNKICDESMEGLSKPETPEELSKWEANTEEMRAIVTKLETHKTKQKGCCSIY
jgi:VIT1/CCC1 family predicted Fe2+/Mn2+ transporter